jgi:trehalose 6-phosphate phosphatase
MSSIHLVEAFLERLAERRNGLLMLDYDGTIAPFHIDRLRAHPSPGILEVLSAIQESGTTRIVFVTGRESGEILNFVKLPRPYEIWGCHGREFRDVDGRITAHGVTPALERALEEGRRLAAAVVGEDMALMKVGAVAVYWRPFTPEQREEMRRRLAVAWAGLIAEHGLQMQVFFTGTELSVANRSKGDSVEALMRDVNPEETCAAFLGDDVTDEEGFLALGERGLSLLVRNEPRDTRAHHRLTLPEGVLWFFNEWLRAGNG